jgi:hypothetical protein
MAGSTAFTMTVTGTSFLPSSLVKWNGNQLATTFIDARTLTAQVPAGDLTDSGATNLTADVTVVNPSPDGGPSATSKFQVLAPITYVQSIDVAANDLAWDPVHGKLYASVPSWAANGNSVVTIDPVTLQVGPR